ncbi:hypothetical protein R3P38DRAFT_3126072 [Favolaschia claudopus]|uniref:Gag protein n=1 Tax=Favolaschia claudopus TaxID=2862362 RepID=A0AAV9ZAC8_9AGAR
MPRATKNAFQVRLHMGDSVQNRAERDNVGEAGCQVDVGQIEKQLNTIFDDPPSDSQIIARILASLPAPQFDNAIRFINGHAASDDYTRSWVIAELLREERILRRDGGLPATPLSTPPNVMTAVTPVQCSNCKRRGHSHPDCFHPGGGKEGQFPAWYNKRGGNAQADQSSPADDHVWAPIVASVDANLPTVIALSAT